MLKLCCLRLMGTFSGKSLCYFHFCLPYESRSTLSGKNLLPFGSATLSREAKRMSKVVVVVFGVFILENGGKHGGVPIYPFRHMP